MRIGSADWYDAHPDAPTAHELAQDAQDAAECEPSTVSPETAEWIRQIIARSSVPEEVINPPSWW